MKRWTITLLVVVACGASAAVGYWFGFRDAWPLGIAAELLPRGSMAVHLLKGVRAGKQGGVIVSLEADVDSVSFGDTKSSATQCAGLGAPYGTSTFVQSTSSTCAKQ